MSKKNLQRRSRRKISHLQDRVLHFLGTFGPVEGFYCTCFCHFSKIINISKTAGGFKKVVSSDPPEMGGFGVQLTCL